MTPRADSWSTLATCSNACESGWRRPRSSRAAGENENGGGSSSPQCDGEGPRAVTSIEGRDLHAMGPHGKRGVRCVHGAVVAAIVPAADKQRSFRVGN